MNHLADRRLLYVSGAGLIGFLVLGVGWNDWRKGAEGISSSRSVGEMSSSSRQRAGEGSVGGVVDLSPAAVFKRKREKVEQAQRAVEDARRLITKLCLQGDPYGAWAMIEPDPGAERERQLDAFFRTADLPLEEIVKLLDELAGEDRVAGISGYWSRFGAADFAKLDLARFDLKTLPEKVLLRQVLGSYVMDPELDPAVRIELMMMASAQVNLGSLKYADLGWLLGSSPVKDGFANWKLLEGVDAKQKEGDSSYSGVEATAVRLMISQDPAKTMDLTLQGQGRAGMFMHIALMEWLNTNYAGADQWYQQRSGQLTPDQSDRAMVAYLRNAIAKNDFDNSMGYYSRIQSPKWKNGMVNEKKAMQQMNPAAVFE